METLLGYPHLFFTAKKDQQFDILSQLELKRSEKHYVDPINSDWTPKKKFEPAELWTGEEEVTSAELSQAGSSQ